MAQKQGRMQNFINYRMRVTLTDGRQLVGEMLSFDKHMDVVLADAEEFRKIKKKGSAPGASDTTEEVKRTMGLMIIRGQNVVSCSVEGPPPADPAARLGNAGPAGAAAPTIAAGPGISRPAGRGLPSGLTGPAAGVGGPAPPGGFGPPGFVGGPPGGFPPAGGPPGFGRGGPPAGGPPGFGGPPPAGFPPGFQGGPPQGFQGPPGGRGFPPGFGR